MEVGSLYPQPVRTVMGYHVFRLQERREIRFIDARESIEKQALIQLRADDMERYVNDLRTRYELQCDTNALSALMQGQRADLTLCTWRGGALTNEAYMDAVASGMCLILDSEMSSGYKKMLTTWPVVRSC